MGPAMPLRCTYCEGKFPSKPNGPKWGFDHYAAICKGKQQPPPHSAPRAKAKAAARSGGNQRKPDDSRGSGLKPKPVDERQLVSKILDGIKSAGSWDNFFSGDCDYDRDFPGTIKPNLVQRQSQRIPAWGGKPVSQGANASVASGGDPEKPVEPLELFDVSGCSPEQKEFLAGLKTKVEPPANAAASVPTKVGRPKATVAIQPSSDSYSKALKSCDLAKRDRDLARKRLQEAYTEFQDAEAELAAAETSVEDTTAAAQQCWKDFQKASSDIGIVAPVPIDQQIVNPRSFEELSTFCDTFARLNPLALPICKEFSGAIDKFSTMVADFHAANAAANANASHVSDGTTGGSTPAVAKAPGTPPITYAAISAADEDAAISDLEEVVTDGASGAISVAAAAKVLSNGTDGIDSDEAKRVIKAQCTETRTRAEALIASGAIEGVKSAG